MKVIGNLLIIAVLATTLILFTSQSPLKEAEAPSVTVREAKVKPKQTTALKVDFMIVTPCIVNEECYEFNDEILTEATEYYAQYGIEVGFVKKKVSINELISLDYDSSTPPPTYGFELKLDLIKATGIDMPHIIHAVDWEAHVLIHEIGHIFGLDDIYNPKSCNLMDGYIKEETFICQRLTPRQIQIMYYSIINFLM